MTPLDYFLDRWRAMPGLPPIYNASNLHVDTSTLPDPWAGVLVQGQDFRNITMGSQPWQQETGSFIVGVFTRAGEGMPDTDTLVRQVRAAFMNYRSPDRVLGIEQIDGPLDVDPAAEDGWHQLALDCRYTAWTQGVAVQP